MKNKYRINIDLLHKKHLKNNILEKRILDWQLTSTAYAGVFYHYTSAEGLLGILKSRSLFFTDCQYLNDSSEKLSINDDLKRFWKENSNKYDKDFLKLVKNLKVNKYEDPGFSYMGNYGISEPVRYFVLSTSFSPDSLSMWKYYAKDYTYNGYCLGLATYALVDEWIEGVDDIRIIDGSVLYFDEEKQNIIHSAVEKLYELWCTYSLSDSLNQKITDEFKSWISVSSLFFKNECFCDEREYRFIAIAPSQKLNNLSYKKENEESKIYKFRIVNGVFTPYLDIPFDVWNSQECYAITSIGIAPSLNSEQKKMGLEQLTNSLSYSFSDCKIYQSNIPLRY